MSKINNHLFRPDLSGLHIENQYQSFASLLSGIYFPKYSRDDLAPKQGIRDGDSGRDRGLYSPTILKNVLKTVWFSQSEVVLHSNLQNFVEKDKGCC